MSNHGGTVFGFAQNISDKLPQTVLAIVIKYMFGGSKIISRIIPVRALTAAFQFEQVSSLINQLKVSGAKVVAIVCDGNQVNAKFLKMFDTEEDQPWLTIDGIHLLYDCVHLTKRIRNNWITERSSEIEFKYEQNGESQKLTATWSDIEKCFKIETLLLKQSKLTYA